MGVVYSPEEVTAGQYPKPGDHLKLGRALLEGAMAGPSILTALVHDSSLLEPGASADYADWLERRQKPIVGLAFELNRVWQRLFEAID